MDLNKMSIEKKKITKKSNKLNTAQYIPKRK